MACGKTGGTPVPLHFSVEVDDFAFGYGDDGFFVGRGFSRYLLATRNSRFGFTDAAHGVDLFYFHIEHFLDRIFDLEFVRRFLYLEGIFP